MILLFAFIVAWLYEVYVVRDGEVNISDMYEQTIDELWWWDLVLAGDGKLSDTSIWKKFAKKDAGTDASPEKDSDTDTQEVLSEDEDSLLKIYESGTFASDEIQVFWSLSDTSRYQVIEFCTPWVDLCKESHTQEMQSFFLTNMENAAYTQEPYLPDFGGIDEQVWAWYYCLEPEMREDYLTAMYDVKKLTAQTFDIAIKKLKTEGLDECIASSRARLFLTRAMSQGKDLFGIRALPTYVLLDTEEQRWISIPGLYPKEDIQKVLTKEFPVLKK